MTLSLKDIEVTRGSAKLLDSVTCEFSAGTLTAVIGPNGAGKSTLLRVAAGLWTPDSGTLIAAGIDVISAGPASRSKRISLMSQRYESPSLPVLDVVLLGRVATLGRFGAAGKGDLHAAREALVDVGMEHLEDRVFSSLSGGERQRVVFAMQTLQATPIALFDEPNSAQDFAGTRLMLSVLRHRATRGDAVVAVVHDLNLALRGFDRVVCLDGGRVIAKGDPDEVLRSDAVRAAFGGAIRVHETDEGPVVLPQL